MPHDVPAEALAHAARRLSEATSLQETLHQIVQSARSTVPGADHVGVTVARPEGGYRTVAATADKTRELDDLQYALGEGPCLHALEVDGPVHVADVQAETRWAAFMEEASRLGLRAQIGVRLVADRSGTAGLNIYSERARGLTEESVKAADLFAAQAALALGKVRAIDQLEEGMRSRQRIGVAVGLLMQRYEMSEERAFAYLVRESSHGNTKLRDVAAEVVAEFHQGLASD